MKINPLEWNEVKSDEIQIPAGLLLLRSSEAFGLLVASQGVETAIGHAATHRVSVPEAGTAFLKRAKGQVIYIKRPPGRTVRMTGRKFTNIDRLPSESGSMDAVTHALKLLRHTERMRNRELREARQIEEIVKQAREKPKDEPQVVEKPVDPPAESKAE